MPSTVRAGGPRRRRAGEQPQPPRRRRRQQQEARAAAAAGHMASILLRSCCGRAPSRLPPPRTAAPRGKKPALCRQRGAWSRGRRGRVGRAAAGHGAGRGRGLGPGARGRRRREDGSRGPGVRADGLGPRGSGLSCLAEAQRWPALWWVAGLGRSDLGLGLGSRGAGTLRRLAPLPRPGQPGVGVWEPRAGRRPVTHSRRDLSRPAAGGGVLSGVRKVF